MQNPDGNDEAADAGTLTWRLYPLCTSRGTTGILGIEREDTRWTPSAEERRLLDALIDQAGVAIERFVLAEEIDQTRLLRATEQLRAALLASVSHDLRTPLTSILGALSSLRSYDAQLERATREDLLKLAHDETERMIRFIANLLDITRLESGALRIKLDPVDVVDVVGSVVRRADRILQSHSVSVALSPDLPMLALDFVLTEQVLFNLLDNARKYADPGSTIQIVGSRSEGHIVLQVIDEGPGIPQGDLQRIFDKFYQVDLEGRRHAGTGLGLSICRGFIEAQGGTISAANRRDRSGAILTIAFQTTTLPKE